MKYKLLVFNEYYADEHNVPALAVMNEDEFKAWCEKPSGELNPKYDEQLKRYNFLEADDKNFWKMLEDKGYTLDGMGNTGKIPKDDIETLKLEREYRERHSYENIVDYPKKVNSNICAYLGNSGECFEEDYSDYYLNKEFLGKVVSVTDVSKEFADTFNEAKLSNLSLCNIFDIDDN